MRGGWVATYYALTRHTTAIIARTVKGKGVSFMEGQASWHGKAPNDEQFEQALKEIEAKEIDG